jgi:hypothetical protein
MISFTGRKTREKGNWESYSGSDEFVDTVPPDPRRTLPRWRLGSRPFFPKGGLVSYGESFVINDLPMLADICPPVPYVHHAANQTIIVIIGFPEEYRGSHPINPRYYAIWVHH